jgi:hypothetical protein
VVKPCDAEKAVPTPVPTPLRAEGGGTTAGVCPKCNTARVCSPKPGEWYDGFHLNPRAVRVHVPGGNPEHEYSDERYGNDDVWFGDFDARNYCKYPKRAYTVALCACARNEAGVAAWRRGDIYEAEVLLSGGGDDDALTVALRHGLGHFCVRDDSNRAWKPDTMTEHPFVFNDDEMPSEAAVAFARAKPPPASEGCGCHALDQAKEAACKGYPVRAVMWYERAQPWIGEHAARPP